MTDLFTTEPEGGLFAASKLPPTPAERVVAEIIATHQGRKNPILIDTLAKATGKSVREIKAIVHELVVSHRLRIGANRGEPAGYFVIMDAADLEAVVGPYKSQIIQMFRRLRVLLSKDELAELHGQLRLEE